MTRYQFIATCTEPWPVQVLCQVLAVSPAGYYQWRHRPAAAPVPWQVAAQAAFTRHARRYGTRRADRLQAPGCGAGRLSRKVDLRLALVDGQCGPAGARPLV